MLSNNKIKYIFILLCGSIQLLQAQKVVLIADTQKIQEFRLEESKIKPAKPFKTIKIDKEVIEEKKGVSLADLLQQNSSIFIKTYGQGSLATASIRGTGAGHARVYWNGIELNQPSLGQIDFSLLPVSFADEVELHMGNSSMVDGFGGLGGSIQLSNSADYNQKLKLDVQSSVGSFSDYRNFAKIALGTQRLSYKASVLFNDIKNDFEFTNVSLPGSPKQKQRHAENNQKAVTQEVYLKLNSKDQLSFKGFYTITDRNIPGLMTNVSESRENQVDRLLLAMLQWTRVGKKYMLDWRTGWAYSELDYNDGDKNLAARNYNSGQKNQLRFKYYFTDKLKLITAAFADFDQAKTGGYGTRKHITKLALLAGVDWKINQHLEAELFIRPEMIRDSVIPFLPSLAVQYQPFLKHRFYLNATWAKNYHFPSLNDLYWTPGGNPNLKAESGWNSEFTIRKQRNNSTAAFQYDIDVTGFYGEIENWILWAPSNKGYWEATNLRSVLHKGIETETGLGYKWNKWTTGLNLSYSYVESTNKSSELSEDEAVGKQLIYVPYHKVQYEASVKRKGYKLVVGYRYTGKRFITTDNSRYLPANDLVDIRFNKFFELKKGHRFFVQAEVANLFEKKYMSLPWRAMAGRSYRLTVRYTLKR